MRYNFQKQVATNMFAIFTILWALVVGYVRFIQLGEVSFLGTLIYFDVLLFGCIFIGFFYPKKKEMR